MGRLLPCTDAGQRRVACRMPNITLPQQPKQETTTTTKTRNNIYKRKHSKETRKPQQAFKHQPLNSRTKQQIKLYVNNKQTDPFKNKPLQYETHSTSFKTHSISSPQISHQQNGSISTRRTSQPFR